MPNKMTDQEKSEIIYLLADEVHQVWAEWMDYMLKCGSITYTPRGGYRWKMDPSKYERWRGQMSTPYADLSEQEKVSDKEIATRYLAIIAAWLEVDDAQTS